MHYGVKGMKWGRRKAQAYANKANIARERSNQMMNKGKVKKANKALAKAKKYDTKSAEANRASNYSKATVEVNKKRSVGHKLATNILAGPFANRTYNSARAAGAGRTGAIVMTAVAAALGGPLGHLGVSALYNHAAKKGDTRKNFDGKGKKYNF